MVEPDLHKALANWFEAKANTEIRAAESKRASQAHSRAVEHQIVCESEILNRSGLGPTRKVRHIKVDQRYVRLTYIEANRIHVEALTIED